MCLDPTIILNPAYSQHRHEFCSLFLNGRQVEQSPLSDSYYYPVLLPNRENLAVNSENLEKFVAVKPDGECVPIFLPVPCNKCLECVESKRSSIRVRMLLEQMSHNCSPIFITLTYNNENLPPDGVSKTDVKRFLNRLHLYLGRAGRPTYFRHVMFSEYGTLHGRAHYHGVLFGLDWVKSGLQLLELFDLIEKAWNRGWIRCEQIRGRAFGYVSKYVGKDVAMDEVKGRNPNFWTASRRDGGLGSQIVNDESFLELCATPQFPTINLPVEDRCYTITLPSYIRDKILPPLRKYVPKRVRDAYLQLRKDLLLAKMAGEKLFEKLDYVLCSRLLRGPITKQENKNSQDYYDLNKLCLNHINTDIDYRLEVDDLIRDVDFDNLIKTFDPLLGHYYGSDDIWRIRIGKVPSSVDFLQLKTRLLANYDILMHHLPDVPFILTQLHARERVSRRFSRRVEKYQSELPPAYDRYVKLFQKNVKEFTTRVKDSQ